MLGFVGISMVVIVLMILLLVYVFLLDEKMNLCKVFGFVVGFIGVVFLMGGDVLVLSGSEMEIWGWFFLLGVIVCYVVCLIVLCKMLVVDFVGLLVVFLLIGVVVIFLIVLIVEGLFFVIL